MREILTLIGSAVLLGATALMLRMAGIRMMAAPALATLRALVQLAVIALVLQGVFTAPWTAVFIVATMLTVASLTSGSRISALNGGRKAAAIGVSCSALIAIGAVFALGMMAVEVRYVIAVSGIVIGNAMNGVTLSGRNFARSARSRAGEVETWLALGAPPQRSFLDIARESVRESLVPSIDQTKSTGLVTLPGAFVGALMGGASPIEAARFQLVVLVAIMFAVTLGSILATRILSHSPSLPPRVAI